MSLSAFTKLFANERGFLAFWCNADTINQFIVWASDSLENIAVHNQKKIIKFLMLSDIA